MFAEDMWFSIYNDVFRLFPPPDNLIKKIEFIFDGKKMEFKSSSELLAFVLSNKLDLDLMLDCDDMIFFYLKDDSLKKEVEELIGNIRKNFNKKKMVK